MSIQLQKWMRKQLTRWLNQESADSDDLLSDYESLSYQIRPADVILVEGRSHISEIIKTITLSSWTHAALYIGYLHEIQDHALREHIRRHYDGISNEPLIIEALLGEGCIIAPLSRYKNYNLRLCRPKGLSPLDAEQVIRHCISHLGLEYDVKQLFDLARFMFPYALLPRKWRSCLFERCTGTSTRTVCSTVIGEAFQKVSFPVLPEIYIDEVSRQHLRKRNPRLFTPRDFDYSPYFEVMKFPVLRLDETAAYRKLSWDNAEDAYHYAEDDFVAIGMEAYLPPRCR